jgi:hypothetical protein
MKGSHRPAQRVVLPNDMWLLLYEDDGSVKLGGYDRRFQVIEVLNRAGGAHVFVTVEPIKLGRAPRDVSPRTNDLITVERGLVAVPFSESSRDRPGPNNPPLEHLVPIGGYTTNRTRSPYDPAQPSSAGTTVRAAPGCRTRRAHCW